MSAQPNFRTFAEAKAAFSDHVAEHEANGVYIPGAVCYATDAMKRDYSIAMDALPGLNTTANGGIPALFTQVVDPQVYKVVFAPQKAVTITGERKVGDWTQKEAIFPTIEHTGEVATYGDFSNNGRAGANTNWPQRQSYLFQVIKEYGDLELETAGAARLSWAAEVDTAAASTLNRFQNYTYFWGVQNLQNYGLLNDPSLPASLTPGVKVAGNGNVWVYQNAPSATANEVFADVQSLVIKLVNQSGGLVDEDSKMTLACAPISSIAFATTNAFGLTARRMIADAFPNLKIVTAPQYGVLSASNPQGIAGGNFVQLIADEIESQQTAYCAFNEKMRAHPMFRALSSFQQKVTGGTWGAIIRQPFAIASMLGV